MWIDRSMGSKERGGGGMWNFGFENDPNSAMVGKNVRKMTLIQEDLIFIFHFRV